jgi:hypothetical protein
MNLNLKRNTIALLYALSLLQGPSHIAVKGGKPKMFFRLKQVFISYTGISLRNAFSFKYIPVVPQNKINRRSKNGKEI